MLFPGKVASLDASSRLLRKVNTSFAVTALISSQFLFIFFACVWFNCFDRNYAITSLIFVERNLTIFLVIFPFPIFFMWGYNISINDNVCNVFDM